MIVEVFVFCFGDDAGARGNVLVLGVVAQFELAGRCDFFGGFASGVFCSRSGGRGLGCCCCCCGALCVVVAGLAPLLGLFDVFFEVGYGAAVWAEEGWVFGLDYGADAFVVPGVGTWCYEEGLAWLVMC